MQAFYSLAAKVVKSNFNQLSAPYKLTYVVTKECHSRCVNCKIWKLKPENELSLDEVEKFARKNPHFSWIDFTGGEPTDRPDFVELVQAFHRYNKNLYLTHFPTNGLKPERIEQVVTKLRSSIKNELIITVSIDGPAEVNDMLRGIKGDFETATETFDRLRRVPKVKVYVGMTLYPQNIELIESTIVAIQKKLPYFERKNFHVNIPHLSSHYYGNEAMNNAQSINQENIQTADFKKRLIESVESFRQNNEFSLSPFSWVENIYQGKVKKYLETGVSPVDCAALMASCYLGETGTVYPCLIWDSPLGQIRETDYDLQPILQAEKTKKHRKQIENKKCPQCWTPCEAYQSLGANAKNPLKLL